MADCSHVFSRFLSCVFCGYSNGADGACCYFKGTITPDFVGSFFWPAWIGLA